MKRILLLSLFIIGLTANWSKAQLVVDNTLTPAQLAQLISGPGIKILNPTVNCGTNGYGKYNATNSNLNITEGLLLTSGTCVNAVGPNNVGNKTTSFGNLSTPSSYPLLDNYTQRTTYEFCEFQFDIVPQGDSLKFDFVFASEEYEEWVGSQYNDVFGFFISGPGIVGDPNASGAKNIALIPGTSTPVTINNVNQNTNTTYYQNNNNGTSVQYDGFTKGLKAISVVQPCQTYHLKLVVADASDKKYDSGVFIEKISSNNVLVLSSTEGSLPHMIEGCNNGTIIFKRPTPLATPLTVTYYIGGTATNGVDYPAVGNVNNAVPKTIVIPANQTTATFSIKPYADGIVESPNEYVTVYLGNPYCSNQIMDSVRVPIQDSLFPTIAPIIDTVCIGSSVQLSSSGGSIFVWSPSTGLNNATISNPLASPTVSTTYTMTTTASTCVDTRKLNIKVSDLAIANTVVPITCNGSNNGSISTVVTGGFSPIKYSWTGPSGFTSTQANLSSLAAGTYNLTVTGRRACTKTASVVITEPSSLAATISSPVSNGFNIACFGASTGTATVVPTGGTSPYTYSWNTSPAQTTATATGLIAGSYSVVVKDANNCSVTKNITLTQPPSFTASIASQVNVLCRGNSTGSATASLSGGVSPYTYTWNTTPVQNTLVASALPSGTYTITIRDANGCTANATATITQPSTVLSGSVTAQTNVLCKGANTGAATATAVGGTSPYTYTWNTTPAQLTTTASGLIAGNYVATLVDANGCSTTVPVSITQPSSNISASITAQTNVLCRGAATGSATISATGGSPGYTYTWNTSPQQIGATANGLIAGTYSCTVYDANACSFAVQVIITQPSSVLSSSITSQTNVLCVGALTGSAIASATGGVSPYTYTWNTTPTQTTSSATSLSVGTYTVTVKDANNCSSTSNVTITQPAVVLSSSISSQTNVLCNGNVTGAATAVSAGGVSPYTFTWNTTPAQLIATASNLVAGNYTVTVKDANSCSTTSNVTITQPAFVLSSTISSQTNVLCFGNTTGAATASAAGGVSPYTYTWNTSPAQLTATASNLSAGTYSVTIKDANNCSSTSSVTISEPAAALTSTISASTNVLCRGNVTGVAMVTPNGGVSPYTYLWNTSPAQTTATASGLAAGTYSVLVKDANNCSSTSTITITQPATNVSSSISSQTHVLCFGNSTGAATVDALGGVSPYTYSWNTSPAQLTATAANLVAGTYSVLVKDANNCSTTSFVTITQPASTLNSSISSTTNVLCRGNATGTSTVNATGGTAPYTYVWNTTPAQTTSTAINLVAGNYLATVTDNNGCTSTATVTITQPAAVVSSTIVSQTDVLCFGNATGAATVNAVGGVSPYTYLWNTTPSQTSNTATSLGQGTYSVTVKDANNCTSISSVTITQPLASLSTSISSQTNVLCRGNNTGSATETPVGGVAPYAYLWNTVPAQTTAIAGSLTAGVYSVLVTDANNCTSTSNVTITQPAANVSSSVTSQTNVLCFGNTTGVATVTASGGVSPYTYTWNSTPVQNSATAINLAVGTYTVTVKDANNCLSTSIATITQPSSVLSASVTSQTNVLCVGNNSGAISVTAVGGVAPYTYSWNTTPVQTNSTATGLIAGAYTVIVKDANNCTKSVSTTITQPAVVLSSSISSSTNVLCRGNATGAATVVPAGGVTPYTYSWNSSPVQSIANATGLIAGIYNVVVTDANGCSSVSTVTITQPATNLSSSITSQTNVLCFGNATGAATVLAAGGVSPYTYSWNTSPVQTTAAASGIISGAYNVVVKDANNCSSTSSVTITQPSAILNGSITTKTNVLCFGNNTGSASVTAVGGVTPYTYSWNTTPAQTNSTAAGLVAGIYTVTIKDANNCAKNVSTTITQPAAVLSSSITAQTNVLCNGNNTGAATVVATGGAGSYTYLWNTTPSQTTSTATNLSAGTYSVTVKDANNCSSISTVIITQPAAVVGSVISSQTNVLCFGLSTGAATVSASGGVAPYTYAWNSSPAQTTATASNLTAGSYVVNVKDANNCVSTSNVTITQSSALLAVAISSSTNVLCFGNATGAATALAVGGSGSYSYSWNTTPVQTTSVASGLVSGTYNVTLSDNNGCSVTSNASVTISQPASPVASSLVASNFNGTSLSCQNSNNGSINLTTNGGTAGYTYAWSGPNGYVSSAEDISSLSAGAYSVTIQDVNGCSIVKTVTLTEPAIIALSNTMTSASCNLLNNGTIDLTVSGGTAPFTYVWTGPSAFSATTQDLVALAAGSYNVTVTDLNGCSKNQSIVVTQPGLLNVSSSLSLYTGGKNIKCNGNTDGFINITTNGGTLPYIYSWTGPSGYSANTEDISNLVAGQYELVVSDSNHCSVNTILNLTQPNVVTPVLTPQVYNGYGVTCNGSTNGAISVNITGGTASYTYSWVGTSGYTASTEDVLGLPVGTYNLFVTDVNGCTGNSSSTITEPSILSSTISSAAVTGGTNITCKDSLDGSVLTNVIGGTQPYQYLWSNGSINSSLVNVGAGNYSVIITDANNCSVTKNITLTQPQLLTLNLSSVPFVGGANISCAGVSDGNISTSVNGGTLGYHFNWSGPNGFAAATSSLTNLAAGTYSLQVTDTNGCVANGSISLTEPVVLQSNLVGATVNGGYNISCDGVSNGSVSISVGGGQGPFTYTWTGSNSYLSNAMNPTLLAAGTYYVTVRDTNGCVTNDSITLAQPPPFNASLSTSVYSGSNQVSCNGATDGSASVNVSGGVTPYTYHWTGTNGLNSSSQNISSIGAGTYYVQVTDINNCVFVDSLVIAEPQILTSSLSNTVYQGGYSVSCSGQNDGAITSTVNGGTTSYSYVWTSTNGFTSTQQNLTNVAAGTYSLIVTDANGCTTNATSTLSAPNNLQPLLTGATVNGGYNIGCDGAANGSININVLGGQGPYTYTWSGANSYSSNAANPISLSAGTYYLAIHDANGCLATDSITLSQAPIFAGSLTTSTYTGSNQVSCNGASDGSAAVNVSGGVTPYTYQWTGVNSFSSTSQNINSLSAGTYYVQVTDINNCVLTDSVVITEPTVLSNILANPSYLGGNGISCNGQSDGAITASVSGGTPSYNYLWHSNNGFSSTQQNINGLASGTYFLSVSDANGCLVKDSLVISAPIVLKPTVTATAYNGGYQVSCNGASNGTAIASALGGTAPYQYAWSGPNGFSQTTATINNLIAGIYTVTITDTNGCVVVNNITINEPAVLSANNTVSSFNGGYSVPCYGSTKGSVSLVTTGGTAAYTYSWSGPNGFTATQGDISSLAAGVYHATITDANQCVDTLSIVLTSPDSLSSSIISYAFAGGLNVSCKDSLDGAIKTVVSGGTLPYSYLWNTGLTDSAITGVGAGTYSVVISDANDCKVTNSLNVTQPTALSVSLNLISYVGGATVSCVGASDGSLSAQINGGTQGYQYLWSGANGFTSTATTVSNLSAGTYSLLVTDTNGCVTSGSATLTEPNPLQPLLSSATVNGGYNIGCDGIANGSVSINVLGGQGPYTYTWTGANSYSSNDANPTLLSAGTYYLTLRDTNGCVATDSITLLQAPTFAGSLTTSTYAGNNQISCNGASDGSAAVNVSGGVAPYSYQWIGANSFSSSSQNINSLSAGTYYVQVSDVNNCVLTDSVIITAPNVLANSLANSSYQGGYAISCNGQSNGAINTSVTGGSPTYSYLWESSNGFTSTQQNISGLAAGSYYLTVTDANGCLLRDSLVIAAPTVLQPTLITSAYNGGYQISCNGASDGTVSASALGGTAPYQYAWSGPNGFSQTTSTINNLLAGVYTVSITDTNGCVSSQSFTLLEPAQLSVNDVVPNFNGGYEVSCYGASNGSVSLVTTGGTAAYTYSWSGPNGYSATQSNISSLVAGVYHATITDANQCVDTLSITLTAPDSLSTSILSVSFIGGANISCTDSLDGVITTVVNGGTLPYHYLWNTGLTDSAIVGVGAGTYSVIISDANNCSVTNSLSITQPIVLSVSLNLTPYVGGSTISCVGANDGSLSAQINGGTQGYQYLWTGANGFTSTATAVSNLNAGTYNLLVTDTNGCVTNASATLTEPTSMSATYITSQFTSGDQISCYGLSDGQIVLTAAGGAPNYSYSWTSVNGFTSTDSYIYNILAGIYNYTVTDSNGCKLIGSITLTQPDSLYSNDSLSAYLAGFNISCNGYNNGSIAANTFGGTAPYLYEWTGPNQFTSSSATISNLVAGTYQINITDDNGCEKIYVENLIQPLPINDTLIPLVYQGGYNIKCFGSATGQLVSATTGGAQPVTHVWSDGAGFTSTADTISSLPAGFYNIVLTDANGCVKTDIIELTEPTQLTNTFVPASFVDGYNIKCKGDASGLISSFAQGGTAGYSYSWSGTNGFTSTNDTISNLPIGSYSVVVTDANGCTVSNSAVLTEPLTSITGNLQASLYPSGNNISCYGLNNGAIDLTFTGGTAGYTFYWRGPIGYSSTTEDVDSLMPGTYNVVVTDSNYCTLSLTQDITQPSTALATQLSTVSHTGPFNIKCNGDNTGEVYSAITGGITPYVYSWTTGNGFASTLDSLHNVLADTYVFTVSDANGCVDVDSLTLTQPSPIVIAINGSQFANGYNISCNGFNNGTLTALAVGGYSHFTYTWAGPNSFTSQTTNISGLGAGLYTLTANDSNGCKNVKDFTLTQPDALVLTFTSAPSICSANSGTVNLTVAGGSTPYNYNWTTGSTNEDLADLPKGNYTVLISDANNCIKQLTATVIEISSMEVTSVIKNIVCNGDSKGSIDLSITNGTAPFTYNWVNGLTTEDINQLDTGAYTVNIKDSLGCTKSITFQITQDPKLIVSLVSPTYSTGYNLSNYQSNDGEIKTTVAGGAEPYVFTWSNNSIEHDLSGLAAGDYSLVVSDANGCVVPTTITLTEPFPLSMPSGFSPNDDGKNDAFVIRGLDLYPDNKVTIFNRWGNIVFEADGYNNAWKGTNVNNEPLPDATYYVVLSIPSLQKDITGFIDLRRK